MVIDGFQYALDGCFRFDAAAMPLKQGKRLLRAQEVEFFDEEALYFFSGSDQYMPVGLRREQVVQSGERSFRVIDHQQIGAVADVFQSADDFVENGLRVLPFGSDVQLLAQALRVDEVVDQVFAQLANPYHMVVLGIILPYIGLRQGRLAQAAQAVDYHYPFVVEE